MHATRGTLHVNKLAAASRQLNAAIRLFFEKEDELAIHTIASAAFRILRDLIKERGENFAADVLQAGIYSMARSYAEGKLSEVQLNLIENTQLMVVVERIIERARTQGGEFDWSQIDISMDIRGEQRMWPSKAANFLKHADRDSQEHLAVNEIKNENVLIGACAAYLKLMRTPTPEMMRMISGTSSRDYTLN